MDMSIGEARLSVEASPSRNDLECSICLELLCEPVSLTCSHVFCRTCLAKLLQKARCCPLCRTTIPQHFNPVVQAVDKPMEEVLMRCCTVEYLQRLEDIAAAAAGMIQLRIGNNVELLGFRAHAGRSRMTYQWSLQVDLEPHGVDNLLANTSLPDIVQNVRFGLKPASAVMSYGSTTVNTKPGEAPSYVEVASPPYQVTATSWIPYTIPIVIVWKDWVNQPPLRLDHHLDFNVDGGFWSYGVEIAEHFGPNDDNPANGSTVMEPLRPSDDNAANGSTVTRYSHASPPQAQQDVDRNGGKRSVWSKAKALMPRASMKLPKFF